MKKTTQEAPEDPRDHWLRHDEMRPPYGVTIRPPGPEETMTINISIPYCIFAIVFHRSLRNGTRMRDEIVRALREHLIVEGAGDVSTHVN
jgi:hypothetical protein